MDAVKVGKLISKLRKDKELTQQEFGDMLGVSHKTVSKWETGNGLPDITILKSISEILGISIEELLDGNIINNKDSNNKKVIVISLMLMVVIAIISLLLIFSLSNKNNKENNNDCTVIRTYYIDGIGKSNDENYLYITVHEFQVEGTFTLKLPKLISGNLKVGNSYEFTFKTSHDYLRVATDILFDNSEVINLEYSDKEGLDRVSKVYCN